MQQLTAEDASFLYLETPNAPMSGGYLNMYDPSTAPGGRVTFKGILAALEARLHLAPSFRQRLVRVPMDMDHPYWVDDVDFDLKYHVRHIALPQPGDLIYSGTPEGVGKVERGQTVHGGIDGLGDLKVRVL